MLRRCGDTMVFIICGNDKICLFFCCCCCIGCCCPCWCVGCSYIIQSGALRTACGRRVASAMGPRERRGFPHGLPLHIILWIHISCIHTSANMWPNWRCACACYKINMHAKMWTRLWPCGRNGISEQYFSGGNKIALGRKITCAGNWPTCS